MRVASCQQAVEEIIPGQALGGHSGLWRGRTK
jgi:hypothetical protein